MNECHHNQSVLDGTNGSLMVEKRMGFDYRFNKLLHIADGIRKEALTMWIPLATAAGLRFGPILIRQSPVREPEMGYRGKLPSSSGSSEMPRTRLFLAHFPISRSLIAVILVLCSLLLLCLPGSVGASGEGDLYAVVVGLKTFQDPRFPRLTLADKDARDFSEFLKDRESYFSKVHLTLLLNEEATRASVAKALRQGLQKAGKGDFVIIYLSGHGAADPSLPNEYYFVTYDTQLDNLFATALMMNDENLFKGIGTDRVLLVADACHAGGFSPGLRKSIATETNNFFSLFQNMQGRISILSSKPDEDSYEEPRYGNSVFTHYLLKGLRGEANRGSQAGVVTAKQIYDYVYGETTDATRGLQHPQLYAPQGQENNQVFRTPTFSQDLKIKVEFFYEGESKQVRPLIDRATLRSGDRVGVAFRSESDSYVTILWWDSTGAVGRLFPNPRLTEGTGQVAGGKTYWLPSREGERWYVLDDRPGEETVYFMASRARNPKIEALYGILSKLSSDNKNSPERKEVTDKLERELNLMGFASFTALKVTNGASFSSKEQLFEAMETETRVVGADAIVKLKIKHVAR